MSRSFFIVCALVIAASSGANVAEAAPGYGAPAGYGSTINPGASNGGVERTRSRPFERNYAVYDTGEANVVHVIRRVRVKQVSRGYRLYRPVANCE